MAHYGTVMVPCEVPIPQPRRTSYYKGLVARFYLSDDEQDCVVIPGRRPSAVYEGLRYGVRKMRFSDEVRVAMWRGNPYLVRKVEGGGF